MTEAPEKIVLTAHERSRFAAWLEQDAKINQGVGDFLEDLPPGTNGARIRRDSLMRAAMQRRLASDIRAGL